MLQFFANLPPLVRVILVCGGTLITTFSGKFPDALQEVGLFLGLGIVSLGVLATVWHALNQRRIRSGRGKISLEPSTLLPAFAVIALVGVLGVGACLIWQALRPSSIQATASPRPATDEPKPLKKMLTAYDVEQRLRVIDTLLEYLDPKLMQISAQGERLDRSIYPAIEKGSAIEELDQFAAAANEALGEYFALAARFQRFPDIYGIAVQHDWPVMEIPKKASLLRAELQEMVQRGQLKVPPAQLSDVFKNNKLMHDFHEVTSGKFWRWINQKRDLLIAKRREYEQADVYPVSSGDVPSDARQTWPDFDKWDQRKEFKLVEIAYLWENQEPSGFPLPAQVQQRFKILEQAMWDKHLKPTSKDVRDAVVTAIDITRGREGKADPNWVIGRDNLLRYVHGTDDMPPFLFPKERV